MEARSASPAGIAGDSAEAFGRRLARYVARTRARTLSLAAPLSPEDACVQSMPDASPAKWHLAHTTWFFDRFVLRAHAPGWAPPLDAADFLWNSYYDAVGPRHERPRRGLLTRPTLAEMLGYRERVDAALDALVATLEPRHPAVPVVRLGIAHEEQHQELLVADAKHLLAQNPLAPAYHDRRPAPGAATAPLRWVPRPGGLVAIGAAPAPAADAGRGGFRFDNEEPRHRAFLEEHALASRPATNAEYLEFVRDGGYARPTLWLADGWATVQAERWSRPLYWRDDLASEFTLAGVAPLDPARPACHLSYYEADAFARWAGARLPTEAEWEAAAATLEPAGHFADSGELHPRAACDAAPLAQVYGDVWEWTASAYAAYPGYRPTAGALGEYNGKFMCNQLVLRGGSCATPAGHVRASYRNFFAPHARWQFAGVRLARDAAGGRPC